ncbi:hypothetical protein ACLO87_09530 [Paenalcaligenes sp. Me52]|uniref:hypothetical protein n=1 Tax=Paenalcaligenes sp. Me52 TaxID=3392038 RepID=UPI003D2E6ED7
MRSNSPTRMGDKRINKFGFSLSINSTMWLLQKITASGRSISIFYSFTFFASVSTTIDAYQSGLSLGRWCYVVP